MMGPDKRESPGGYFLQKVFATGFYSGYVPWASGTAGSLVAVLIYLIPGFEAPFVLVPAIVIFFVLGAHASARVAEVEGNRMIKTTAVAKSVFSGGVSGEPDPSIVVIDEIVGMWVALLFIPKTLAAIGLAFVLFRLLDIVKPFPARRLEQVPGGWGIMLDDLAAGLYANLVCRISVGLALIGS